MRVESIWVTRLHEVKQRTRAVIKLDRICVAWRLKVKRRGNMCPWWLRQFSICSHMFGIGMRNIRKSIKLGEDMEEVEQKRSGTVFRKPKRSSQFFQTKKVLSGAGGREDWVIRVVRVEK